MKTIFSYSDYKAYLNDWIDSQPGRGWKAKLAVTIGCNTTYITHVFRGHAHLSLEQTDAASSLLSHSKEEKAFFILLVQFGRAGTVSLREFLKEQMRVAVEQNFKLKDRLKFTKVLNQEDQATYYSSWYYSAILISLTIPELQTVSQLAKYFALPEKKVREVLGFLTEKGLAISESSRYKTGPVSIHLGADSVNIYIHHMNWRVRAMESLDHSREEDLHYSSVISIAKEDEVKVREILVGAIEKVRAVVRGSKEDSVYAYNIDLFSLEN